MHAGRRSFSTLIALCLLHAACGRSTTLQTKPDASPAAKLSIVAVSGLNQSAKVGSVFEAPLRALVFDETSAPVAGVAVAFAGPSTGAGATFNGSASVVVLTDDAGIATSPVPVANGLEGAYQILASIPNVAPASFDLTNLPAPAVDRNLALGKPATQISLFSNANPDASMAVDGNTDGNFLKGSVSHTVPVANAWWQVDLGSSTEVAQIVVWNRTDFRADRLSNFWVFLSDTPFADTDTPSTLQSRAGTWSSFQASTPYYSRSMSVGGARGRYVRVQLTGSEPLSLAEVQVFASAGSNVAQGKPASQSGTLLAKPSAAGLAVDGNTDGVLDDCSVAHTDSAPNAWWQVDLGASAAVSTIVIWNRTDCCKERLADYWIFLSDTPFAAADVPATLQGRAGTWSSHQTKIPNPSSTIPIGAQGRYVRVQLTGSDYLNLAEVEVIGR